MKPSCRLATLAATTLLAGASGAADPTPSTLAAHTNPETVPEAYLSRLAAAHIPADAAAAVVVPLDDGSLAFRANDAKPMNPASTMKLVTTYSALHLLGPAYTFRTEVLAQGPLAGDVLRGDLHVRAGGDPHLVIENLWQLV